MKAKYFFSILFSLITFYSNAQNDDNIQEFYYYKGEKIPLKINRNRLVIYFDENSNFEQQIEKVHKVDRRAIINENHSKNGKKIHSLELILPNPEMYNDVYSSFRKNINIKSVGLVVGDTLSVMLSNYIYVKLKSEIDTLILKQKLLEINTETTRNVTFCEKWYAIEVTNKSGSNSLNIANYLAESGLFDKVDPGFIFDFSSNCVTDTRFSEQWSINTSDVDINACNAWNLTRGNNNVVLAIIDQGIDNSHAEFVGIPFVNSFDAEDRIGPAQLHGDHGTHVCGITSANHNASSIAGVAPGLSIMEISHPLTTIPTISEDLAAGINWAIQNGADILSNSWGDQGGALFNQLHSELLEDAIDKF